MGKEYDIEAMVARKREIEDEMNRLADEAKEIDIALKVLRRFSTSSSAGETRLGPPRPEGAPTLFEMTVSILKAAEERGRGGLKGAEIVAEIGKEFWPGVQGPQVLPTIYQFARKGRIVKKDDGRFYTAQKDEAPTG